MNKHSYRSVKNTDPSRPGKYIAEHRVIAERALGKPLPRSAEVHHVNGVAHDNRNENLVICQDQAYHKLLHARARALHRAHKAHEAQDRGPSPVISMAELGGELGLHPATIRALCRHGKLPARQLGGLWIVPRRAWERFPQEKKEALRARP